MIPKDPRRLVPLAGALVALCATLIGWLVLPPSPEPQPESDWPRYYRPLARSLADGNGFAPLESGESVTTYPPGFPLLAATAFAVGDRLGLSEETAHRGLNLLCVALGGALVSALAGAASLRKGIAGAILWSAYPPMLWLTARPMSEVPFAVLLLASFAAWRAALHAASFRPWLWLACGTLAGCAALVRPIAALLGGLLALLAYVRAQPGSRRALRAAGAGLVVASWVLTVLPWSVWATRQAGHVVLLGEGARYSMIDGLTWALETKGYRSNDSTSPAVRNAMAGFQALGRSPTLAAIAQEVRRQATERPSGLAQLVGWKLIRPLWGTDSGRHERLVAAINLALLLFYLLAIRSATADPAARTTLIAAGAILALFWAMSFAVLPIARYLASPLAMICGLLPLALPRSLDRSIPGPADS